jgi:5-methylcytosine-specific restriction protein A
MKRVCLEPGCPNMAEDYLNRRCYLHSKEREGVIHDKDRKRIYNSRRWRYLRGKRLTINPICQGCGRELARDVDHVVSLEQGGRAYDLANTQALCSTCHGQKTSAEMRTK